MSARFDLDDLPLPYRFDVQALNAWENAALLAHINQVGLEPYRRGE